MNLELQQKLYDRFNFLDPDEMFCGFSCGDGWFDLLWELSEELEKLIGDNESDIFVHQIKEKFGGLRFYLGHGTDEMWDLVYDYEKKSFKICEECGEEGKLRQHGYWYLTRCGSCWEEIVDGEV